jgi:hypothetical protein
VEVPSVNTSEVFWPLFKDQIPTMTGDELVKQNWVLPELKAQIELFRPRSDHISPTDNARNKEVLSRYLEALFPQGRIFASHYQVKQLLGLIGEPWAFMVSRKNKMYGCTLGSTDANRKVKNRTVKDDTGCPFFIGYTVLGFTDKIRREGKHPLQFPCKITQAHYKHTCDCSTVSNCLAITVGHRNIPKAEVMEDVVALV